MQVTSGTQEVALASGKVTRLTNESLGIQAWSPDGNSILCTAGNRLSRPASGGRARLLTILDTTLPATTISASRPMGSMWSMYPMNRARRKSTLHHFRPLQPNVRYRSSGGAYPAWARGGKEILYRAADGRVDERGDPERIHPRGGRAEAPFQSCRI